MTKLPWNTTLVQPDSFLDSSNTEHPLCQAAFVLAIRDSLDVVSGKWKLAIVCTLLEGPRSFSEIERLLKDITPRMLSIELRKLEISLVVQKDPEVQRGGVRKYALTPSGQALETVIVAMASWGQSHRALSATPRDHGLESDR